MSGSGILEQVVNIKMVSKSHATHFVLCKGDAIRYLISLKGGRKKLSKNITSYSHKLSFLMKIINYLPLHIIKIAHLGYFVNAVLCLEIQKYFEDTKMTNWNMIVGTYNVKQKLVLQCFKESEALSIFIKIGNESSAKEMTTELEFYQQPHSYVNFDLPELLATQHMDGENRFNIQVTKEFTGDKVEPVLTDPIYKIYKEIAGRTEYRDGVAYELSHGDFAPWNMKVNDGRYIIFDWENCAKRIRGFDLVHYVTSVKEKLNRKTLDEALDIAIEQVKLLEPDFDINKDLFLKEYKKIRL